LRQAPKDQDGKAHSEQGSETRECVAALLIKDGTLLAEERKLAKSVMPGAIALPGGHVGLDLDIDRLALAEYLRVYADA
jgi:hypothetical protein